MSSVEESSPVATKRNEEPWYRCLTRYHWFVLLVAALGWLFDTMDQQLFVLARKPAITALLHTNPNDPRVDEYGAWATSIFIVGWALGGLIFGVVGDRLGRVKTMMLTILVYSLFTGLSALSVGVWDFSLYRFLSGLGVGGEFAVGVALVAEAMPDRARPQALGWLQASSALGNMFAALTSILLGFFQIKQDWAWRFMFLVGIVPAGLVLLIMGRLREPARWQAAVTGPGHLKAGSMAELFGNPRWRRNALIGLMLAVPGVVGLWGIGFFSADLQRSVFGKMFKEQGLSPAEIGSQLTYWVGIASLLQNLGGFFGVYAFSRATQFMGRKPAFALSFVLAMFGSAFTFWYLKELRDLYWMIPMMGFCQFTLFGGYAIYFPELFPTRLRSTGTSFCYNVGRFIAASGPLTLGYLTSHVFANHGTDAMRYAGVSMTAIFLIGLFALPFAPETRGQPLPD